MLENIHYNSNTTKNSKEHIVNEILKINNNYVIDKIPLKKCYENLTNKELSDILYEVTEALVLIKCNDLWVNNKMQDAYDFFLSYEKMFEKKLSLANTIIELKPEEKVGFFGDIYPLSDIDPVELALYYSHQELLQLIESSGDELLELFEKTVINREELEFKKDIIEKIRSQIKENSKINCELNLALSNELLVQQFNLRQLKEIQSEIKFNIEKQYKQELDDKLFDVTAEFNLNKISTPITFDFANDTFDRLVRENDTLELKQAIDSVYNEDQLFVNDNSENTIFITEQIFMLALEKGIKILREPININFDLDDIEDIVNNYSFNEIKATLSEIQQFEATIQQNKELFNTLETARKYLEGRSEEIEEKDWHSYAPSFIKDQIEGLDLQPAYNIVLAKSKEKTLNDKSKKLIMEYRFDLEEMIFGNNSILDQPLYFEEFKEYPFEEYVRQTVEAIILPHIEVLEKIEKNKGNIQFVDIWTQHFSDNLKQKVRERDGFKCVVCDEETNLHVHHKIPRKYGGVNHPDNLVLLCSSCHGAIETADFEHAYQKCMLNAIKSKTSLQNVVDTSKDIYLLKEEIKIELDELFVKIERRDETLAQLLLQTMKKIEYVFES